LFTGGEWKAFLLLILLTFSTTELAKRIHRKFLCRYGKQEIWLEAFIFGAFWSYVIWPAASTTVWYIPGIIAGPVTSALHRGVLGWMKSKYPATHAAITGDRRKKRR